MTRLMPFSKSCRSIKIDVIVVVHSGLQTLSHSLAGFADGGRENPFLASHQQVVPATILPSDMDAF
jgi:hypothetical protein